MKNKIFKRLKEPSTWLGLAMLAGLLGIPPELIAVGSKLAAAIGAIVGIALPEGSK